MEKSIEYLAAINPTLQRGVNARKLDLALAMTVG